MNIWKFFNLINLFKKIKEWWNKRKDKEPNGHPDLDIVTLGGRIMMVQQKGYPPYVPLDRERRCRIVKIHGDYGLVHIFNYVNISGKEDGVTVTARLIKSGELGVFVLGSDEFSFIY